MLTCEKCGFNQVPEYVKSEPDSPVLCIGCRMSKFVRGKNDLIKTSMRSINAKQHEWSLIEFNAIIHGVGEKKTFYREAVYECPTCEVQEIIKPNEFYLITAPIQYCNDNHPKQKMELRMDLSKTENIMEVLLEEPTEEALDSQQNRYQGWIKGELINQVVIGGRKKIQAVFKSIPRKDKPNDIVLDVVDMADLEEKEECVLSEEQVNYYKLAALQDPQFLAKVKDSITDKVGLEDIKLSLLVCMAGGDRSITDRKEIHALIMGDPSLAKSELLKFCYEITPRSKFVSGDSTGKVGLRGGIETLSNGGHVFVPGVMTMASDSILYFDEIDKTGRDDLSGMLLALEQQFIPYDKIIHAKLPAKTGLVAAANPKSGVYDDQATLIQNFNLPYPLLSRFDLKWLVVDSSSEGHDARIAKYTSPSYQKQEPFMSKKILSAYISYIRKLAPVMSKEADEHINSFWIQARKAKGEKRGGFRVDVRTLQSLRRISTAFAKLQFHENVTLDDAQQSTALYTRSLASVGQDIVSGETHQTIFDGKKESKDKTFNDAVNKLARIDPIIEPLALEAELMNSGNYDRWQAKEKIESELRRGSVIIKTYNDKYKVAI